MKSVRIDRDDLLSKVQQNADNHKAEFDQAFEGFRRKMRERLEEHLVMLGRGETPPITIGLVVPRDHSDDYQQVISMLTLSVDDVIELEHHEFAQYVMDDWGWKPEHMTTSALYSRE